MRQDAVGCVVVEVPAGDEYTNDRRKSCADVWQAHTTTIWQPPPYPIPIGKTNAESSISAHALLFSILLNGLIVIPGVTWRWSPASHPIVICTHIRSNIRGLKPSKFLNTKRRAVQIFYNVLICGIIIRRRFCADPMRVSFYLFLVCL